MTGNYILFLLGCFVTGYISSFLFYKRRLRCAKKELEETKRLLFMVEKQDNESKETP